MPQTAATQGVRLLQSAYHNRSLSLYANLGFQVRDLSACMQGTPPQGEVAGYRIRRATAGDADACATVCRRVHGHDRTGELSDAIEQGTALVVEHDGRISRYASDLALFLHAVGESNEDLRALIMAADAFAGPGILADRTRPAVCRIPWVCGSRLSPTPVMPRRRSTCRS